MNTRQRVSEVFASSKEFQRSYSVCFGSPNQIYFSTTESSVKLSIQSGTKELHPLVVAVVTLFLSLCGTIELDIESGEWKKCDTYTGIQKGR